MKHKISILLFIGLFGCATILIFNSTFSERNVEDDLHSENSTDSTHPSSAKIMGDNEVTYDTDGETDSKALTQEALVDRDIASSIKETQSVQGPLDDWLKKLKKKDFKYQTTEDGKSIMTVLGGEFHGVGKDEGTAYGFLAEFAGKIGVDAEQLNKDSLFTSQTIRKKTWGFEQTFKGFPVFDSYLKMETKREDYAAYMILNNLKIIPQSTELPEISVDLEQAKNNALNSLNEEFTKASPTEDQMVVYAPQGKNIDLAWSLLLQGNHVSEFVLVSATTGQVLANYSAQSH